MNLKQNEIREKSDDEAVKYFKDLIKSVNLLRDNKDGCPWQKAQNHKTLSPFLIEECFEFIHAIEKKDKNNMVEELGDILFQIMLHAEIGTKSENFNLEDIFIRLNKKIKKRHPYIFKDQKIVSIEEANQIWRKMKKEEDPNYNSNKVSMNLLSVIESLPPTAGTEKIAKEVSRFGFKWKNVNKIFEKLKEEIKELKMAIEEKNSNNIEEEFGDIFFTLINLAFFLKIDHQNSLIKANKKFIKRFAIIEEYISDNKNYQDSDSFENLWLMAKQVTKNIN